MQSELAAQNDVQESQVLRTWRMHWLCPMILSVLLIFSAFFVRSQSAVIAIIAGGCGILVIIGTPFMLRHCRIEMTKDCFTVFGLLGNVEKTLLKSEICSVDLPQTAEDIPWIRTTQGKYCVPNSYRNYKEVIHVLRGWASENELEKSSLSQ
ncbi:MAG: hypothetical protein WCG75_00375 [Armatimonadota bacterium]